MPWKRSPKCPMDRPDVCEHLVHLSDKGKKTKHNDGHQEEMTGVTTETQRTRPCTLTAPRTDRKPRGIMGSTVCSETHARGCSWRLAGSDTDGRPRRRHRDHHPRSEGRRRGAASRLINSPCLSAQQQALAKGPRRRQLPPLLILFLTSLFGPAAVTRFHLSGLKVLCSRLFSVPVMPTPPPRLWPPGAASRACWGPHGCR